MSSQSRYMLALSPAGSRLERLVPMISERRRFRSRLMLKLDQKEPHKRSRLSYLVRVKRVERFT